MEASNVDLYADFLAGWCGGAAGLVIGHPLDTVKVRWQTLNYSRLFNVVRSTLKNEAAAGFFKGMSFPFLSVGFVHAIYFGGYGFGLKLMNPGIDTKAKHFEPHINQVLIASCMSGAMQVIPACPIDVIKVRLQIQRENVGHIWDSSRSLHSDKPSLYLSPLDCARKIYAHFGLRNGLFKGFNAMLVRDLTQSALYIPIYETCRRKIHGFNDQYKQMAVLLSGGLTGAVAWFISLPFDVIKNKIQADDFSNPKYRGFYHCVQSSYQTEGWKIFFRGGTVTVIRAFPVNAAIFFVYYHSLQFFSGLV